MALVTYGTIVTDISGTLAGVIYTRGHSGPMIRSPTSKPWVDTARRQAVRTAMTTAHTLWADYMTSSGRQAWEQYAAGTPMPGRMGKPIQLSGYAMFLRSQSLRCWADLGPILATPIVHGLPAFPRVTAISAWALYGTLHATFSALNSWLLQPDALLFTTITQLHPQTRVTEQYPGRLSSTIIQGDPGNTLPYPASIVSPYGTWPNQVGDLIYVHFQVLHPDNRLSARATFRVPLTTPP